MVAFCHFSFPGTIGTFGRKASRHQDKILGGACLKTGAGVGFALQKPAIERIERTGYVGSPETVASKLILEKDETGIYYMIFQCAPTTRALPLCIHTE